MWLQSLTEQTQCSPVQSHSRLNTLISIGLGWNNSAQEISALVKQFFSNFAKGIKLRNLIKRGKEHQTTTRHSQHTDRCSQGPMHKYKTNTQKTAQQIIPHQSKTAFLGKAFSRLMIHIGLDMLNEVYSLQPLEVKIGSAPILISMIAI